MVGRIVLDDECKDCNSADLSVSSLYSNDSGMVHYLYCSHENACRRMELYCLKKQQEEEENAL